MSASNDDHQWLHFYQETSSTFPDPEATTVTTTPTQLMSPSEGRVSKPIRRRSRASRRTPTTLLNTDTTNFRSMVQQFTGGPTAPFAQAVGFGFGSRPPVNPANTNRLVFEQQQQQQLYQQHNYMFGGGGNREAEVAQNRFFQRLSNPTPSPTDTNVNDEGAGLFMVDHQVQGRFFPPST